MTTRRLTGAEGIAEAARLLAEGEAVAIPTETVYGLACILTDSAVERVYAAKGRPSDNPLIVHIAEPEDIHAVARTVSESAMALAERFWPGPLTLVLPKQSHIPSSVTAGLDTVAVRCPAHETARAVIRATRQPLAAPSANRSGSPSPTTARHVLDDLDGRIPAVLDAGPCTVGLESTVLSLAVGEGHKPRLLRPGGVTREELEAVIGPIEVDKAVMSEPDAHETPSAPGMKYRHYAPHTPLVIVHGPAETVREYALAQPGRCGLLCLDGEAAVFEDEMPVVRYTPQSLFDALRRVDSLGLDRVFVRVPEPEGVYLAVVNRLQKAAGFCQVSVDCLEWEL